MGLVTIQPRGMGMYPTNEDGTPNPCFDPNRSSLLPYWIDNWNEGKCFYLPGGAGGHTVNPAAVPGATPSDGSGGGLDATINSLAGIAIVLGIAYMFLGLYLRKGR